jgi:hypothetical protein
MLSKQEYNKIIYQLNEPSSKILTDTKKKLRKKLKEHEYSTKLAPFDPLPHIPYFINRTTSEQIVHQLIQAAGDGIYCGYRIMECVSTIKQTSTYSTSNTFTT